MFKGRHRATAITQAAYQDMQTFTFECDAAPDGLTTWSCEVESVRAAQVQAVQTIGAMLSDHGEAFWLKEGASMTVSDEAGLVLFRLDLSAVIAPALLKA